MLFPELEDKLRHARHALDWATSDNIIELCKQYLALLAEYRAELYRLPDTLGINQWSGSFLWEDVCSVRKAVRAAIENTTRERNGTEALLLSFTSVSGYEAVETLNGQKYKGYDDWELRAGGVNGFQNSHSLSRDVTAKSGDTSGLLRREEHITRSAASARLSATMRHGICSA
ncbi:MAG: hypothetical protein DMF65_11325 [Acidobacteria bacterium]|nr:MAG: hypothetical protein DMF65_11325 [Acidobacteriota bacterium]